MSIQDKNAVAGLRLISTPEDVRSMPMATVGLVAEGVAVADAGDGLRCAAIDGTLRPIGITVRADIGKTGVDTNGNEAWKQYDTVPVMRVGRVWVKPAVPITATGVAVHVLADGQLGLTGGQPLVGATWDSVTSVDGLAIVQLRGA
jgi:hypothetical protein